MRLLIFIVFVLFAACNSAYCQTVATAGGTLTTRYDDKSQKSEILLNGKTIKTIPDNIYDINTKWQHNGETVALLSDHPGSTGLYACYFVKINKSGSYIFTDEFSAPLDASKVKQKGSLIAIEYKDKSSLSVAYKYDMATGKLTRNESKSTKMNSKDCKQLYEKYMDLGDAAYKNNVKYVSVDRSMHFVDKLGIMYKNVYYYADCDNVNYGALSEIFNASLKHTKFVNYDYFKKRVCK
jgi:hypothetical protein